MHNEKCRTRRNLYILHLAFCIQAAVSSSRLALDPETERAQHGWTDGITDQRRIPRSAAFRARSAEMGPSGSRQSQNGSSISAAKSAITCGLTRSVDTATVAAARVSDSRGTDLRVFFARKGDDMDWQRPAL